LKAYLVFLDESGLLMAPLVRRSWSPCGLTPVFYQRTRSHQKVSVIAALCVAPDRNRVHLYFRLHPGRNINSQAVMDFLRHLVRQLRAPIILVWDRLLAHRSKKVQKFLLNTPPLHAHFLPAYAPELNPVENVWGYLKLNPLANHAPDDLFTLTSDARSCTRSLQRNQLLLRSFLQHTPLSFRLI
jgi:transposase